MRGSITEKNTRITILADIIQESRIVLSKENINKSFSSDETRRIVLLCLIYVYAQQEYGGEIPCGLSDVIDKLNIVDISKDWLSDNLDSETINVQKTISNLSKLIDQDDWHGLLNYSYEALEYDIDDYFAIDVNRGVRRANPKKKRRGIYYTPEDVIEFMVSQCIETLQTKRIIHKMSFMDCSCGTGVFLLRILAKLDSLYNTEHSLDISLQLLDKCIWGVDISPKAIDNCKMVFMTYYLDRYPIAKKRLDDIWSILCNSFYVGDSTNLENIIEHNEKLPDKYDCIIGNPPYVTYGKTSNLFIKFVENLIEYSSDKSCSSLIVPLSICYSQGAGFVELRKKLLTDSARWEFFNYDRSPDALFGDQIKTRNTILFRKTNKSEKAIHTTKLQRWTSENRKELFKNINLCDITGIDIIRRLPKLSFNTEKNVFLQISNGETCIADMVSKTSNKDSFLVMNGTAYNWLCAYDHFPPSLDEHGQLYVSNTCSIHTFIQQNDRYFSIALLSNRIAYWYWTVIGDGFHLNSSFLSDYRIGKANFSEKQYKKLCDLGREYCERIKMNPNVSYNARKKIINYSHWEVMDVVEQIEEVIKQSLNLPEDFCVYLREWYLNQVSCNRKKERGR